MNTNGLREGDDDHVSDHPSHITKEDMTDKYYWDIPITKESVNTDYDIIEGGVVKESSSPAKNILPDVADDTSIGKFAIIGGHPAIDEDHHGRLGISEDASEDTSIGKFDFIAGHPTIDEDHHGRLEVAKDSMIGFATIAGHPTTGEDYRGRSEVLPDVAEDTSIRTMGMH